MKKKKIWETITRLTFAFMFVASWAVLGVALALKTAKIEINGGITFTATDVYAKISGSVTGTKTSNPIDEHPIEIDASTSSDFTVDSSWTNMNLDFQNASTPIVVTITIENKSSERPFWIVFADNIEEYNEGYKSQDLSSMFENNDEANAIYCGHNTSVLRKIDGTELDSSRYVTPIKLAEASSITIETALNPHNADHAINDNFKLGIELIGENAIKNESEYTKLTFTTNDTNKTASVKASSIDIEGDVVIPALFSKNGEVYTVTEIEGHKDSLEPDPSENYGFGNCTNSISLFIPATITKIGFLSVYNSSVSLSMECLIGWISGNGFDSVHDYNAKNLYPYNLYYYTLVR